MSTTVLKRKRGIEISTEKLKHQRGIEISTEKLKHQRGGVEYVNDSIETSTENGNINGEVAT